MILKVERIKYVLTAGSKPLITFCIHKDLEAMMAVECIIPQEHHPVLSTRGSKMQNVRRQFNVTIKLPDHEKSNDADTVTVNGVPPADDFEYEFQANFEA
ncbi:hypothetical protein NPIL_489631 [Nephila pilipes]|uniref:Uncharacterized protein n=1 Tax=Nephila pilipes TaxID=299642 RepID=A0A8X6P2W3_NEPPI|nr:hypothetical protein NPIL_489631 [Nephila pilipes]